MNMRHMMNRPPMGQGRPRQNPPKVDFAGNPLPDSGARPLSLGMGFASGSGNYGAPQMPPGMFRPTAPNPSPGPSPAMTGPNPLAQFFQPTSPTAPVAGATGPMAFNKFGQGGL